MKKSELRQLIREEIKRLNEGESLEYSIDYYKTDVDRKILKTDTISTTSLQDATAKFIMLTKKNNVAYSELFHGDMFIGSTSKKRGYKWQSGPDFKTFLTKYGPKLK
jgi:hypothetical protein